MEGRVGMPLLERWSGDSLFARCFEKAGVEAEQDVSIKKAPRLPVAILVAFELGVLDQSLPLVTRVVLWARLLKVYASLRGDDLQRMRPDSVHLLPSGLSGSLGRTKTTGGGKKIRELVVFVPTEAWLVADGWLAEGHRLWVELAPWPRDHFLPRALSDLSGFSKKHAGTSDLAGMYTDALRQVGRPTYRGGAWGAEGWQWVPAEVVGAWTGHSERTTLSSALAALGVGKEARNPLGRWAPEGSDNYVRTYRSLVRRLISQFTTEVQTGHAHNSVDEDNTFLDVRRALLKKGASLTEGVLETFAADAKLVLGCFGKEAGETKGRPEREIKALAKNVDEGSGDEGADGTNENVTYYISTSHRGSVLTLHKRDGCWRAAGQRFSIYEEIEGDAPDPTRYTAVCRMCWPKGQGVDGGSASEGSESSSSSSS